MLNRHSVLFRQTNPRRMLVCDLIIVHGLLLIENVLTDAQQLIQLNFGLGSHVIHFYNAG